jgi:hypothetical protein
MSFRYEYDLTSFPNGIDAYTLSNTIGPQKCLGVQVFKQHAEIIMEEETDVDILDGFVLSHVPPPPEPVDKAFYVEDLAYRDYGEHYITKTLSGVQFTSNTPKTLTNWVDGDGTLSTFDNETGSMTFGKEGIYCFGINALVQTSGNNNNINIRVYDGNGVTRFIQTQELNGMSPEAAGGACTFTAPNHMRQGEVLFVECEFNQNETCDFLLKIIKIL